MSRRLNIDFVLLARVAVLEVGTAGAANQQRIAGENAVRHDEAIGIVGVPGRIDYFERKPLDREFVAVGKRIETTSALVCSPITVMQCVRVAQRTEAR